MSSSKRSFVLIAALSLLSLAACQRKAPGPEECQRVALQLTGVNDPRLLQVPRIKAKFDRIVVICLTTPFDRELVRCFEEQRGTQSCLRAFQERQQAEDPERLRDPLQ